MRANGYYWVQLDAEMEWEVASYEDGEWWLCGGDTPLTSEQFHEIGAKIERS